MRTTRPYRIAVWRATIGEIGVPISYVSVSLPHLHGPPLKWDLQRLEAQLILPLINLTHCLSAVLQDQS